MTRSMIQTMAEKASGLLDDLEELERAFPIDVVGPRDRAALKTIAVCLEKMASSRAQFERDVPENEFFGGQPHSRASRR